MRSVLIFFAGFAAGVLLVGGLILRTRSTVDSASSAGANPDVQMTPVPEPKHTDVPPELANLIIPVQGVKAGELRDTFPDAREGHAHQALDIPAPRGTPVLAVAEGNVVKLFQSKPGGTTVYQFDDTQNWCFYYAHLDRYAKDLTEGTLLRKGDVLGYVGTTGNAPPNTPHLHFAIFRLGPQKRWWEGTAVNPFPYLHPSK